MSKQGRIRCYILFCFTILPSIIYSQLRWNSDSGIYEATEPHNKIASVSYSTFFAVDSTTNKKIFTDMKYFIKVGANTVLNINPVVKNKNLIITTVSADNSKETRIIALEDFVKKNEDLSYQRGNTYIMILKNVGIVIINYPIKANYKDAILHLLPEIDPAG
jgi:hypothetical protein